jgi:hypothetical protein
MTTIQNIVQINITIPYHTISMTIVKIIIKFKFKFHKQTSNSTQRAKHESYTVTFTMALPQFLRKIILELFRGCTVFQSLGSAVTRWLKIDPRLFLNQINDI